MIKSRIALAGALLAAAGAANAGEFTVSPAITTDYDFRGLSQTDEDPAFQLGANYAFDNGFYLGAWGSNVDFPGADADIELDVFAGFSGGDADESFAYDVGAILYAYPGSDDAEEVVELYAGLSKGMFSGKFWFSPDNYGDTSMYIEGNVKVPLPHNFALLGHVGYSFGDYWKPDEYVDYSVGVDYTVSNITFNLKYVDVSKESFERSKNGNKFIFSVSTTLPWASE